MRYAHQHTHRQISVAGPFCIYFERKPCINCIRRLRNTFICSEFSRQKMLPLILSHAHSQLSIYMFSRRRKNPNRNEAVVTQYAHGQRERDRNCGRKYEMRQRQRKWGRNQKIVDMILQTYRFLWVFSFIEIFHVNMTSNEFCKCSLGYVYLRHFGCPMTTIDTSQTIDGNIRSAFVIVGVCYSFFLFRSSSPPY